MTRIHTNSRCSQIEASEDIDEDMDRIIRVHQEKHPHNVLHCVAYY